MTVPHVMSMPPWRLHPRGGGRYSAHVLFWMLARWTVTVHVARRGAAAATSRLEVDTRPPVSRASASKLRLRASKNGIGPGLLAAAAAVGVVVIALALGVFLSRYRARSQSGEANS
jgi:hypothetical protein